MPRLIRAGIFSLISHHGDIAELPHVSPKYEVVPLYASQWVLPEFFQPRPLGDRDIDLIMVANFATVKRHWALFSALRQLPARFKIHLIGQDQDGRTAQTLRQEAAWYGVADRFTIQSNVPNYMDVAAAMCRARASVILSQREGSCVVVAESMFANTPGRIATRRRNRLAGVHQPGHGPLFAAWELGGTANRVDRAGGRFHPAGLGGAKHRLLPKQPVAQRLAQATRSAGL